MKKLPTERMISLGQKAWSKKSLFFFALFLIFAFLSLAYVSQKNLLTVPKKGGEINEIVLESKIRFINPVLALSPIDKDLMSLVYSPLIKINDKGEVEDGIASYTLGADKKTYTLRLRDNVYFHDGVQLTADDVLFTIEKIKDPLIKSPYYGPWLEVETRRIDNLTLEIELKNEYYQFIKSLVLYILPQHLWQNVAPEEFPFSNLNIKPIGSGPFQIDQVTRNTAGEIEQYVLSSFPEHYSQEPYLDFVKFHFFNDWEEYQESNLTTETPNLTFFTDTYEMAEEVFSEGVIHSLQTPKVFGLFVRAFEENTLLSNSSFRDLLSKIATQLINEEDISVTIEDFEELDGFAYSETGELVLDEKPVTFTLTFFQNEKFNDLATQIKQVLSEYGLQVNLQEIRSTNTLEDIIRERTFEVIIFGYDPGLVADWFYFFHSSQINDPGVNIAGIKDGTIDKLLLELRTHLTPEERITKMKEINQKIESSDLFIPLYSVQEFYKVPGELKNFELQRIDSRTNRFDNVEYWYLKEERILPFLITN